MSMEVEGSLVITQVDEDDDAKYQCLAKNVVGTRGSEKAQLSVLGNDLFISWLWLKFSQSKYSMRKNFDLKINALHCFSMNQLGIFI